MTAKSAESLDSGLERERSTKLTVASRPAHYDSLIVALIALTFTTGLIDAVSYLGLGRVFTANMTGNVVLLGFAAIGVPGLSVTRSLIALGGFLVGAAFGGRLGTVMASATRRRWLLTAAVAEAALIFAAALASLGFDIDSADSGQSPVCGHCVDCCGDGACATLRSVASLFQTSLPQC